MTTNRQRLTDDAIRELTLPTEPWLSCEDCFELSDAFAELVLADPGTNELLPMWVHLRACRACAEEAESLVELVAQERGIDASAVVRRLHE